MNWFGTYLEVDPEVGTPGLGGLCRVIWFGGVPSHDDSVKVMTMVNAPPFKTTFAAHVKSGLVLNIR